MIKKINIPLVYDNPPKSNIWWSRQNQDDITHFHTSETHGVILPWLFRIFEPLVTIHSSQDIDQLDWFIYPVIFNEPYYQIRSLLGFHHPHFGFWRHVSPKVIQALKDKKGWIIIDASLEPLSDSDLHELLENLKDCSTFPNDRILLNVGSLTYCDHPRVYNIATWLEAHFCGYLVDRDTDFVYKDLPRNFLKKLFYEEVWDLSDPLPRKRFCLFNARYTKHVASASIFKVFDKLNLFKKGYVTGDEIGNFDKNFSKLLYENYPFSQILKSSALNNADDIIIFPPRLEKFLISSDFNLVVEAYFDNKSITWPFISEKTWRSIGFKKPFILLGQFESLKKLHKLGYKTFDPYINESYDTESDDVHRFYLVIKEAIKLIEMTEDEFNDLNKYLKSVCDFNEQNFRKRLYDAYHFILNLKEGNLKLPLEEFDDKLIIRR